MFKHFLRKPIENDSAPEQNIALVAFVQLTRDALAYCKENVTVGMIESIAQSVLHLSGTIPSKSKEDCQPLGYPSDWDKILSSNCKFVATDKADRDCLRRLSLRMSAYPRLTLEKLIILCQVHEGRQLINIGILSCFLDKEFRAAYEADANMLD